MTTNFSQTQFSNFLTHLDTKLILDNRSNNILAEILQGRNNYSFLTLCWLCYFSFQRPLQLISHDNPHAQLDGDYRNCF